MKPQSNTFTDNALTLRPMRVTDAPSIVEAAQESVTEIMPWMSWCTPDYDLATATTWLKSLTPAWRAGTQYAFTILDASNGRFLGGISLNHINRVHRLANLGYWVRTSATCQGVASQAARMVARFGVEKLGLIRVEIVVSVGNQASLRAAEKAGARPEGVLRNRLIIRERVTDAVMHALIPQDFGIPIK